MAGQRVFVYEHVAGGGMAGEALPMSLRVEGMAMLRAVLEDLADVPGVSVVASLDARLVDQRPTTAQVVLVEPEDTDAVFERETARADVTLLIAPEFDDILLSLARRLEKKGVTTIGSNVDGIALASDKLRTANRLTEAGIPTLSTDTFERAPAPFGFPVVVKPRKGAGSGDIRQIDDASAYDEMVSRTGDRGPPPNAVVQPYHAGLAASISFLIGPGQTIALPPATQRLSDDGRFRYHGGTLPLPPALAERAVALGRRAVAAVEGLRGYVGVDLILGDADDGSRDVVVEINPRLTTSYVGLRAMTPDNLSDAWLKICAGVEVPPLEWYNHSVRFTCDGRVRLS